MQVHAAAKPLGLSAKMLRDARKPLGIRTIRINPFKPEQQSWWLLPGQELPRGTAATDDLEQWLAPLRQQFPPRTPLDEDDE